MRGYPEFNFPAFHEATEHLRLFGSFVFSPAERDVKEGFDPTGMNGTMEELDAINFDMRKALSADCKFICEEATHIFMLPGWSKSSGATAERALGLALGLVIEGAPA
jgi:hypothetical protein